MSKIKNLIGIKYGLLTPIKRMPSNKNGKVIWLCKCECGNETEAIGSSLLSRNTLSCGCIKRELLSKRNIVHGLAKTETGSVSKLYTIWLSMKQRCNDSNNSHYKYYGGKGIRVCDEWNNDYQTFHNWAIDNGYAIGLSIERDKIDENYSPSNCRWIIKALQARNKSTNHFITYKNKTKTLVEWSELCGIKQETLRYRIKKKWPMDKVFTSK